MTRPATSPGRAASPLVPIAWISLGAVALWLVFSHGFVQYDTFYALVWGSEIADGHKPDYAAPLSPTPHPLATLLGVVLSPLGDGAETAVLVIAYLSLAAVAYMTYRLGAEWFNPAVGALAAAIMITRQPLLDFGVRAYVDIPYLALLLCALLIETRRPRAGVPVLVALAIAGLLRPEAWLLSAAYVVYVAYTAPDRPRGSLAAPALAFVRDRGGLALIALAAAAPLTWIAFDWVYAGDPLHSLTGTRDTVEALDRDTGLVALIVEGPQRIGEVLREPVLLGAAVGIALALLFLRPRAAIGLAALGLALAAFSVLAIAGLAVLPRYLLPAATILAIFCAAGVFGWLSLPRGHPWRTRWGAAGVLLAVVLIAFVPAQVDRIDDLRGSIEAQDRLGDDLHELADSGAFDPSCAPVTVPDERAIPFLALWLDRDPSEILTPEEAKRTATRGEPAGYFLIGRSQNAQELFTLAPSDSVREEPPIPNEARRAGSNESWDVYAVCNTDSDG